MLVSTSLLMIYNKQSLITPHFIPYFYLSHIFAKFSVLIYHQCPVTFFNISTVIHSPANILMPRSTRYKR